ncbi:ROK family protein [Derxia gummosa]|uniref:ROK family protein n=1 Tax=Derxia gummosa DSM 723 TaxID=1121388 RepID=A0A8B6X7I4_9BURK|nr:ROK family protein [Derxia gummosa]
MPRDRVGQGRNSVHLRRFNERLLLQLLRRMGEASKADLARRADLTNTAVGGIIDALDIDGLIESAGRRAEGGRGQPAALIRLKPSGAYAIGVRLDRDSLQTVLIDFSGTVLDRRMHNLLLPAPAEALDIIEADVRAILADMSADARERLTGIGLAQPYNLGAWLRELDLGSAHFKEWDTVDFGALLSERLALPVFSENDGNAAAIAELFYGLGARLDDFLYVFLGPAIGGGVAVGGDCMRGSTGNAADIAVMPVPPSTLASAPEARGRWSILMARASLNALVRHLRFHGLVADTHAEIERHIRDGHPAVDEWIADCVDALAPALRGAICLLDLPVIVFDCDVDAGLVERLMRELDHALRHDAPEARDTPDIVRGSFGPDAGAIGAASLPLFFNFSPRAQVLLGQGSEAA